MALRALNLSGAFEKRAPGWDRVNFFPLRLRVERSLEIRTKLERRLETLSLFFHRSEFEYGFTVRHSSQSLAHARGVHVTWMLTPFVKISEVTPSFMTGSFRIEHKGDSVTFIVRTFHWTLSQHL